MAAPARDEAARTLGKTRRSLHRTHASRPSFPCACAHLQVQIIGASSSTDNSDDANSGGSGGGAAAAGNGEKDEKVLGGRKGDNPEQVEFEFRLHLYRAKLLLLQQQVTWMGRRIDGWSTDTAVHATMPAQSSPQPLPCPFSSPPSPPPC